MRLVKVVAPEGRGAEVAQLALSVGIRELIGLAATAQVALIPVWAGISLVFGFVPQEVAQRLLTFALNLVAITGAAAGVYALLGLRAGVVRRFTSRAAAK